MCCVSSNAHSHFISLLVWHLFEGWIYSIPCLSEEKHGIHNVLHLPSQKGSTTSIESSFLWYVHDTDEMDLIVNRVIGMTSFCPIGRLDYSFSVTLSVSQADSRPVTYVLPPTQRDVM